jgi:hypothetical protein
MEKLVTLRKPFDCKQVLPANSGGTTRVTFEVFYAPRAQRWWRTSIIVVMDGKSLIEIATLAHDVRWN